MKLKTAGIKDIKYPIKVREKGGDIKIAALQSKVFNVFDLLGFPMLFDIMESEDEAIAKFKE